MSATDPLIAAGAQLRARQVSSTELTDAVLRRADEVDGVLGAYLTRFDGTARAAAARADAELAAGVDAGPLQGVTVGVKDLLAAAEGPTTAQSLTLDPAWGRGRDAAVVTALRRAGAVLTGKVTLSEFAIGRPDPDKPFPVPRNPWDVGTWPGGSSSGTAVGVAAGLFLGGIGTDTGGSIRIPSAFCGITGLKPTFGLVPTEGCLPLAETLDHVGPMARTAADCRAILDVIAGPFAGRHLDPVDRDRPLAGLRVGAVRADHFGPGADPAAEPAFDAALAVLEQLGAELREVELPLYRATRTASLVAIQAEGFAFHRDRLRTRWADLFDTTREMLGVGAFVSGADYVRAQQVRAAARAALTTLFAEVDVVATPTITVGAPDYGPGLRVDVHALLGQIHTGYWNATGLPALAAPIGFTAVGRPLSIQLAAPVLHDHLLLDVAVAYQGVTTWHAARPPEPPAIAPVIGVRESAAEGEVEPIAAALVAAAGLPAEATAALAPGYAAQRELLDSLYAVPGLPS